MGILRIGRIELKVLDLEKSVDYYTNLIGLDEVGREGNRVYLKAWDEWDHHSVILQEADSAGVGHVAFKVETADDMEQFEKKIEQFGCSVTRVSKGNRMGEGETLRFEIPTGHIAELYHEIEQVGTKVGTLNPHPWPEDTKGIAPHCFDHCLLSGEDVETVTRFFTDVLDLHMSEKIVSSNGKEMIASWLHARNGKPHDIAFIKGPDKKLHHAGFYVSNWHEVLRAADLLGRYNVPLEISPTRHGVTRGQTIYFFDPSGNRNETYTGGYTAYYDQPTITWTEDRVAQGIFYHTRQLVDSFGKALT
ncbi:MAG: catechol 2,3-dioxygenase [Thermoactinomyces sp.]